MRLFLAIKPDRPIEPQLARRLLQVQEAIGPMAPALRWTPAENIHITLHFLGEVAPEPAARVRDRLGDRIDEPPFEITLGGAGCFPSSGSCRVVWLDLTDGSDGLLRVHAAIGRRLAEAGVVLDAKPLSPHLTIARVPDRERARVSGLRERLGDVGATPIRWIADRVVLFRSDLAGPVPRYEAWHTVMLAASGS